jgi:hypothetical protein
MVIGEIGFAIYCCLCGRSLSKGPTIAHPKCGVVHTSCLAVALARRRRTRWDG